MPLVMIERILSVNGEDLAHPATNLLNSDSNKKWKCKVGEKQVSVILQLKQEVIIDEIDIGNENSAFIEVLVGKASNSTDDFKVLLVASSLMTLKEAKEGSNANGVHFFKKAQFLTPTANEKWDRVKIVCTQPWNKHVQFGLSFLVMRSSQADDSSGEASKALGRFALKQKDDEQPSVGNWFAKRKDPPPPIPPGAAAAVRDASTPLGVAQGKNKKPTPKRPKNTPPNNAGPSKAKQTKKEEEKQLTKPNTPQPSPVQKFQQNTPPFNIRLGDDDSPADDTDADSTYSPTKDKTSALTDDDDEITEDSDGDSDAGTPKKVKREKRPKRDSSKKVKNIHTPNGKTPKRKNLDTGGSAAKTPKRQVETKPFGRLLEGVTIVISGYQNPLRGQLRSKACAMGSKYKADWDPSCTHLICAFVNTPKFNQVKGRGKIVKKEWVEECHSRRKRFPWRRFCLDRNDCGASSEEEIWEEGSVPSGSNSNTTSVNATITSGINRRRASVSSGSDTEEEIERVRARQNATAKGPKKQQTTPKPKPSPKAKKAEQTSKAPERTTNNPYDDETDVESDKESSTANLPLPPLPDLFENIVFHIAPDVEEDERKQLLRYIKAYKGSISDEVDSSVEYVLTKSTDVAAEVGEEFGIMSVSPDWIWECSDEQSLVPVNKFTL